MAAKKEDRLGRRHSGMSQWNFVMHPVFAAKRADPEGDYIREWVPELRGLPKECGPARATHSF